MKKLIVTSFLISLFMAPVGALAASCAEIAGESAGELGGEVIAVKADGPNCLIKIRIPSKNGNPPRIESITVAK